MTTTETALNNLIIGQGWERNAASPERLGLSGSLNHRVVELALANVTVDSLGAMSDQDFEDFLAA